VMLAAGLEGLAFGHGDAYFGTQLYAANLTLGTVDKVSPAGVVTPFAAGLPGAAYPQFVTSGPYALGGLPALYVDDGVSSVWVITPMAIPEEAGVFEFSLDIGSDHELSDPNMDGDEWFDPGDVYLWWPPIWSPQNGFKDDASIFGQDPPPDPFVAGSQVPVGQGDPSWYLHYFDLDGHDQLDFEIQELHEPPIPADVLPSLLCLYEPMALYWSYDDDQAPGWCGPVPPGGDVPVTAPSPAGLIYGTTALADEIIGAVVIPGVPSGLAGPPIGVANELMVNFGLWPNPDLTENDDDDVDSLDAQVEQVEPTIRCPFWYFTVDHEATWFGLGGVPLDPGDIYLANPSMLPGPIMVVDNSQLGLPDGTDVDAFEFVLLLHPQMPGGLFLAVLFSVDEDDPLTPNVDESGGLNPNEVYASFMDGMWWDYLVLDDDVDALTVYPKDPVKAPNLIPNAPSIYPPEPPLDGTLPKTQNNVIYLVFDEAIAIGPGNPVTIQQLIASVPETLGPDLAGSFTYSIVSTNIINDTLKCKENGAVLTNQTWYRIKPTVNLTGAVSGVPANLFVVDLVTLQGDGDCSKQVLALDYFTVKNHLFQVTDNRYDLDGSGQVLALDYFVVKNNLFATAPPKP
ncbi:MAG: hypothetical protein ACE5K7_02005, partial [Phycisphaerae bacterium]